ncbi:MAG: hypothetical protein HGA47_13425, partial [Zoogloea sp.]|nr:hypothetical protein [Zoogloea sp.]
MHGRSPNPIENAHPASPGSRGRRAAGTLALLACLLAAAPGGAGADAPLTSVALVYAKTPPLASLKAFDVVVVEADHGFDPAAYRTGRSELFAYVSVGEAHPTRAYADRIPAAWRLGQNETWQSTIIDQSVPEWPAFFADEVIAPLWNRGYRGFFLDTLDSWRLVEGTVPSAQRHGLVAVVRTLQTRFPGIRLILNRGFDILPEVSDAVYAVAAESVFRGWQADTQRYTEVGEADRNWLLGELGQVRDRYHLPVIAIDYVPPQSRALARDTARRIQQLGLIPWVSDGALEGLGVGSVEVMPRKVLMLYNGSETPQSFQSPGHRYAELPLNHLGYVVEHRDAAQPLPDALPAGEYAGIVTWFSGPLPQPAGRRLAAWLQARIAEGRKVAVMGDFGYPLGAQEARLLGIEPLKGEARGKLAIVSQVPQMAFETRPQASRRELLPLRATAAGLTPWLGLRDEAGHELIGAALAPWGGFVLDPFLISGPENQERWVVDPFAFLAGALAL